MLRQALFDFVGARRMARCSLLASRPDASRSRALDPGDLVLDAMRVAERTHRNADSGSYLREVVAGGDRSARFLHLAEVAWMLEEAGYVLEVVAAGFLHDLIEDRGYTEACLAREIGNERVAKLVAAVSDTDQGRSRQERTEEYLNRMKTARADVLGLSCADKTSHLKEMNRLLVRGYPAGDYRRLNHSARLRECELLEPVYRAEVPAPIFRRFSRALAEFRGLG